MTAPDTAAPKPLNCPRCGRFTCMDADPGAEAMMLLHRLDECGRS